jgi:hypothetical protein
MNRPSEGHGGAPQYSGDGRWWWNGEKWVAVPRESWIEQPFHGQIRLPAAGLIVIGGLNFGLGLFWAFGVFHSLVTGQTQANLSGHNTAYAVGAIAAQVLGLVGIIGAPFILTGGVAMLSGRGYALSRTAAVLAMVPAVSCCFVLGIPAGIWALTTLRRPGIRASFR